jgi:dynein heavy chain
MGCAPAGPAGTGKTETTKDLGSAVGKAVYVFNCSPEMDFRSMGDIFKGLAASGCWGCFDEFNRLVAEVLSVCSTQVYAVLSAIRQKAGKCTVEGAEVKLDPTCGLFITMNPGYLGRTELPESLKNLFRPLTVVVPDLELICENMLMAEGFIEAKELARKFVTLYMLCRDLLSKAMHYDWGLRAIKSVLVVAGTFKRAELEQPEQGLLMRALRDFNLPKIVADDLVIFFGLLGDLFPGIDLPRKRDLQFEKVIEEVTRESGLVPDEDFLLKVVQLSELLAIRHCVFLLGLPGAGRTECYRMLALAQTKVGSKTYTRDLNPKAISTNELYGYIQMATREWRDGLLSSVMRELANSPDQNPKWIVLDGDLDANWIESMNSVMDDNRLLTLASNERINLHPWMRLIFEIRDLKYANPVLARIDSACLAAHPPS